MNIRKGDQARREFIDGDPQQRLNLIERVAYHCYAAWDTWDIGPGPYGVQLAYLFATIAQAGTWSFTLEMVHDGDSEEIPFSVALQNLFANDHDIWLYVDREWNGLPETSCPVCSHDCEGAYPLRICRECGFDERRQDLKTYQPVANHCPFCGGRELSEIGSSAPATTVDGVTGVVLSEWQCRGKCEGRSFWV